MRRLFLILLACMALVPSLPAGAQAAHRHVAACAACPASTGHDADCSDHGCLGCSIAPDAAPHLAPRDRRRAEPVQAAAVLALTPHHPGFEPPPPRAAG